MMPKRQERKYKPAQAARALSERFGHKVTPSAIRKWDNFIFPYLSKERAKGTARNYSDRDIEFFNAIAVLRNLGYSLEDTRAIMPDIVAHKGEGKSFIVEVKSRIEKQEKGFGQMLAFIKMTDTKKGR